MSHCSSDPNCELGPRCPDTTTVHDTSWIPDGHDMATVWTSSALLAVELDRIRDGGTAMDGMMTTPAVDRVDITMTPAMAATLATIIHAAGRTTRHGRTSCNNCGMVTRWTTGADTVPDTDHPWTMDGAS